MTDRGVPPGIDIVPLHWEHHGEGEPVLVATGWAVPSPDYVLPLMPTAASGRRLTTFHYRDTGLSGRSASLPTHSTAAYAAGLLAWLEQHRTDGGATSSPGSRAVRDHLDIGSNPSL